MARPTKVQQLIKKIETAQNKINEKAADSLVDMYDIIEAVAKNTKATDASRMAAAKYVIERAEDYLDEQSKPEEEGIKTEEVSVDLTQPLISYQPSEKH